MSSAYSSEFEPGDEAKGPPLFVTTTNACSQPSAAQESSSSYAVHGEEFFVQVVTDGPMGRARMLVNLMYEKRGYKRELQFVQEPVAGEITLEAVNNERIYGTLTLRIDSPRGLLADSLYPQEVRSLRGEGRTLCEITELAADPRFNSPQLLASLFHRAYIIGRRIHQVSDLVIEVHPRHAGYYCRMLGFRELGDERMCPRVDAPAVLLHLALPYVDEQIAKWGGTRKSGKRASLYCYFLSKAEEDQAYSQIRRAIGVDAPNNGA